MAKQFELRIPRRMPLVFDTKLEAKASMETCYLLDVDCELFEVTKNEEKRVGHVFNGGKTLQIND